MIRHKQYTRYIDLHNVNRPSFICTDIFVDPLGRIDSFTFPAQFDFIIWCFMIVILLFLSNFYESKVITIANLDAQRNDL